MMNGNGNVKEQEVYDLDVYVPFRWNSTLLAEVDDLAQLEDRDRSWMIRKLIELGKIHYRQINSS